MIALAEDGTVWQWRQGASTPISVPALTGIQDIASVQNASFALRGDGQVLVWGGTERAGYVDSGLLGDGEPAGKALEPQPVQNLTDVVSVWAGYEVVSAIKADGTTWMWGRVWEEAAQDPPTSGSHYISLPTELVGAPPLAGVYGPFGWTADGELWSWERTTRLVDGSGGAEQLGGAAQIVGPSPVSLVVDRYAVQADCKILILREDTCSGITRATAPATDDRLSEHLVGGEFVLDIAPNVLLIK